MAMAQGFSREQVESILANIRSSELIDEVARALLIFAEKMTCEPAKITLEDVETLRGAGLSDEGILEGVQVISLFNYMDRMADALGTPVENLREMMG